jgi:hypothetical protein
MLNIVFYSIITYILNVTIVKKKICRTFFFSKNLYVIYFLMLNVIFFKYEDKNPSFHGPLPSCTRIKHLCYSLFTKYIISDVFSRLFFNTSGRVLTCSKIVHSLRFHGNYEPLKVIEIIPDFYFVHQNPKLL